MGMYPNSNLYLKIFIIFHKLNHKYFIFLNRIIRFTFINILSEKLNNFVNRTSIAAFFKLDECIGIEKFVLTEPLVCFCNYLLKFINFFKPFIL